MDTPYFSKKGLIPKMGVLSGQNFVPTLADPDLNVSGDSASKGFLFDIFLSG